MGTRPDVAGDVALLDAGAHFRLRSQTKNRRGGARRLRLDCDARDLPDRNQHLVSDHDQPSAMVVLLQGLHRPCSSAAR